MITEYILAASLFLNAAAAWLWYRRREIMNAVFTLKDAYNDNEISEEEYMRLLEKLEAVFEKV